MAATCFDEGEEQQEGRRPGGQMSLLEHLDELRRRVTHSAVFVFVALVLSSRRAPRWRRASRGGWVDGSASLRTSRFNF